MSDSESGRQWDIAPIAGVAIAVVLTIVLAAIVTMVVLGVNEVSEGNAPDAEFSFSYNASADPATRDSFGNTGSGFDGTLTVTHTDGDPVDAGDLVLTGASSERGRAPFAPDGGYSVEDRVSAGDSVTIWVTDEDVVEVVWEDIDSGESATLKTWSGSSS